MPANRQGVLPDQRATRGRVLSGDKIPSLNLQYPDSGKEIPIHQLLSVGRMTLLVFAKNAIEVGPFRQALYWREGIKSVWVGEKQVQEPRMEIDSPNWSDSRNQVRRFLGFRDKSGWVLLAGDGTVLGKGFIHEVSRFGEFLLDIRRGQNLTKSRCSHAGPLFVYTHLGLGDLIICQAILRNIYSVLSASGRGLSIFAKPRFLKSARFLLRDLEGLEILEMDDSEVQAFLRTIPISSRVVIGHDFLPFFLNTKLSFDHAFYEIAGLAFRRRWDDFHVVRDSPSEKRIFDHFRVREGNYIFLHEDASRNLRIDRRHFNQSELPVVEPQSGLTDNIFDYLYLMERAREIHCIDSCFRLMADSVFASRPGLYFHQRLLDRVRKDTSGLFSSSRLSWKIV